MNYFNENDQQNHSNQSPSNAGDQIDPREAARNLLDAALDLAASGIPVFPCAAEKHPVCAGGFKVATTDPARIKALFARGAARLIGAPMGPASGLVAVDVDPRHDGDVWLMENDFRLTTRRHSTQSGGTHLLYLDGGHLIKNSAGQIAPGVDVRGTGGYICFPPSPGYAVTDPADVAEMPAWLVALCQKPAVDAPLPQVDRGPRPGIAQGDGGTRYGLAALASATAAIRQAGDGMKHRALAREAFAMGGLVASGELTDSFAGQELAAALWDIAPSCADYSKAQKTLKDQFAAGKAKPRVTPDMPARPEPDFSAPIFDMIAEMAAAMHRASTAAPLPVRHGIMDLDGALKLFVDYCEATTVSTQPFLALAAGISVIGALAGRKYATPTNLRTNIYAVGVADSGAGKDHARKCAKAILRDADLTAFLGGEDMASGAGMMTALARHPSLVFMIDEFGNWLAEILNTRASPHKKQISQRLKTLYSSASDFILGAEYADQSKKSGKPREDIHNPNACVYGTTTPGQSWEGVQGGALQDGLLARFLIFVSPESYPDKKPGGMVPPPLELIAAFQAIAGGPDGAGNLGAVMASGIGMDAYTVPMTAGADAAYEAMGLHQLDRTLPHF